MLNVVGILAAAADTATIFLQRKDGRPLDYQAGQFLTLILAINGRELRRSYSFGSAPGVDEVAFITVKRVINGEVSRYLLDHLRVGDELRSLAPAGRFVLEEKEKSQGKEDAITEMAKGRATGSGGRRLFFIAAGSGMVPVFSLLKKALADNHEPESRVVLFTQHHDEGSLLYKRSLEELAKQYGDRFSWVSMLSSKNGRLNNWLLEALVRSALASQVKSGQEPDRLQPDPLFYLCGPPAFMRMVKFTLRLMGFADAQIKMENFTVEYVPPPPLLTDTTPKRITIRIGERALRFEAAWPDTILQAAERRHIALPFSCRGGRCSTCVTKCLSGKVTMSVNEVLTEKDLEEGLVLICVGYAETNVELAY